MTNLEALYRNICQFPDEDSYRLIYADCLDEQDDADSKTLAEYIRLSIALEHPPQQASMVSISEWKSRETLGAEMVKRMWRKWTECVCPMCREKCTPICPTCNGTGDILKEKIHTATIEGSIHDEAIAMVSQSVSPRRMSFRRGFLNIVYTRRLSDVWKDGKPTLWADALVRHTPIDIIMVNDLHPLALRVGSNRRDYRYRWFMADDENQLPIGRVPGQLFQTMWNISNKEQRKEHYDEMIRGNWRCIECSSLQEAKSLCGRALGRMVREAVYGKQEQMAISEEQRK